VVNIGFANCWPMEGSFGVLTPVKGEPRCPGSLPASASGVPFCMVEIGLLRLNPALCSSLGNRLHAGC